MCLPKSPLILDALENILSVKVQENPNYPKEVCHMCCGNIRILFDLKLLFDKSQSILEKYVSSLESSFSEEYLYKLENGNSKILISADNNNDLVDKFSLNKAEVMNFTEKDVPELDMPKKIVKLKIARKGQNNVKVKWVEGNKFIIEKNENVSTTHVPHVVHSTVHKCSHCHKRFLSKEKLTDHLGSCRKFVVVKCEFCDNKFSSLARQQYHIKVRHNPEAPLIKCDLCNQEFKNYNARSYHKLTRHSVEGKKYSCELCGKAFFIKNSLNQHMESHSRNVSRVRYVSLEEKDLDSLGNSSHLAELLNSLQKKTMVVGSALPDLQNVDISHNNLVALDDTSESQETSRGRIMQNKIIEVSKIKFQLKSLKGNKLTIGKDQNIAKEKSIYLEDQLDSSKDENNSLLAALPNLCSMKSGNLVMMNASITAHKDSHKSNNGPTELLTGSNEAIKFDRKMFEGDQFIIEEDLNFPKMVLKCSYCQEEFISNEKLAQHLAVCNRFALIKCDFCNRNFSSSASKAFHMKMKHVPIQPEIKCEICNLVFKNSRTLVYHQKTKHNAKGKTFVCELCGKSFYLKNGLTQHMDTHNKAVSKVVCPICGKSFHYKGKCVPQSRKLQLKCDMQSDLESYVTLQ
ncbi:hypothetical protein NQ314_001146 [Rhamnusium bicolor]|uniref:C2H2-type domain-containing protein n=1 Tax=Rhamnusium bicolor TaxID=1586634 RepID=A0AAV8ZT65_9CUCU|nr:hypothetical protein NQ314_001146 [Rhamnusium bicolor]